MGETGGGGLKAALLDPGGPRLPDDFLHQALPPPPSEEAIGRWADGLRDVAARQVAVIEGEDTEAELVAVADAGGEVFAIRSARSGQIRLAMLEDGRFLLLDASELQADIDRRQAEIDAMTGMLALL